MPIVTVSKHGQLVIPQWICEKLALHEGSKLLLEFSESGKTMTLRLIEGPQSISLRGILKHARVLEELEAEHRTEIEHDEQRIGS